ncbi:helix-turn-helix domain-containing protein [Clostridium sp. HBUAS56010]|uniref:helix-turn-helix domain-containing protein n=1 Tax=Clostridium sp. HBUAS56010 TaxID=2571127 RepID=UPI0011775F57|nr:helix-turn-helix domain-containing protein [Clostridium sp. HBUAS56010]
MPKLKLSEYEQKKIMARATLKNRMEIKQISMKAMAKRLNKPKSTLYNRFANPGIIRLDDLWTLVSLLGLSDEEILQIVRGKEKV